MKNLITNIEAYLKKYMVFPEPGYSLVYALWIVATHIFDSFDCFPYICITASTKQAGKTRCAELASFACGNPMFGSGSTAQSIFYRFDISESAKKRGVKPPTVFIDEAEERAKADVGIWREFLNSGYRRGQTMFRVNREFPTYSPKVFILIGDLNDTLRDRSIVFILKRAQAPERFLYSVVQAEGAALRDEIVYVLDSEREKIQAVYPSFLGIDFMPSDREIEIWAPLFAVADRLCPTRMMELKQIALDMAMQKTAPIRTHKELVQEEDKAIEDQFANRLLLDMKGILQHHKALSTLDIINALVELPLAPWRRFRGIGITPLDIGAMLGRFGIKPRAVQIGTSKHGKTRKIQKGYKKTDIERAAEQAGL